MRSQRVVIWLLRICLLTCVLGVTSADQEASAASRLIAGHEYAMSDDRWYVVSDDRPAALIDRNFLVVRFIGGARLENYDLQALGLPRLENVMGRFADGHYVLRTPPGWNPFEVADAMDKTGIFEDIHFSVLYEPFSSTPDDDHYDDQWNLHRIRMSEAWELTTGAQGVVVGVIDSGVDYYHEDLASNIWANIGYDFYDYDSDPYPDDGCGHGTLMAGIIAAATNNSKGVSGIAGGWGSQPGVSIMVMDAGHYIGYPYEACYMNDFAVAAAVDSAVAWGAKVLNMSFGADEEVDIMKSAIDRAVYDHDVAVVAASGIRGGPDSENRLFRWPARWSNVISVGATEQDDSWWFPDSPLPGEDYFGSCLGNSPAESLDIVAPGDIPIWSTDITGEPGDNDGDYSNLANSTSGACAHAAGVVALMRSVNPLLTWWQVRDILRDTVDKDIPGMEGRVYTDSLGFGRLDAYEAIQSADALWRARYDAEIHPGHTISSNTTWPISSNYKNVYLTGDVTVGSGATLTITPGTTVYFATTGTYELRVAGALVADASSADSITFRSAEDNPAAGDWSGIFTQDNSGEVTMRNCVIKHGDAFGLKLYEGGGASSLIEHCVFDSCQTALLMIHGDVNATIRHCTFYVDCPYGIYIDGSYEPTDVVIDSCLVMGTPSASYGVYVVTGDPTIRDNCICSFGTGTGIAAMLAGTATVSADSLYYCKTGMRTEYAANPAIIGQPSPVRFEGCTTGLYTEDTSSPTMTGVEIEYCTTGIETRDSSAPTIDEDNVVSACGKGLYVRDTSAPYVRNTTFEGCTTASVNVSSYYAEPDLGTVADAGNNSFYAGGECGSSYKHVRVKGRYPGVGDVMAEYNWWGVYPPGASCFSGGVDYTPSLSSDPNAVQPSIARRETLPSRPALWQNYPNPFSGSTLISYQVPNPGAGVILRIYDATGRLVRILVDQRQEPGPHQVVWAGDNKDGRVIPSGVYFYQIEIGDDFKASKKMSLVR